MKEIIDIEALLHRAYAQYRVDRVTPQSLLGLARLGPGGSLVGAMQAVALGTIVDNSGAAARMIGLQTMQAATPDDMLVVHDHVLALADWLIEEAHSSAPQVWRRDEIASRGWFVEETAHGLWLVRPGEGQKGTDTRASLTNPYLVALVIEHARAGTRPDDLGVSERARQTVARRGRPDRAALAERGDVMLARAVYATWHASLGVLAAELNGALVKHRVTGPAAAAEPWNRVAPTEMIGAEAEKTVPAE
jgi:hypothetical protein